MRLAFTGTSSTGKTTLANRVVASPRGRAWGGKFLTTNARGLLQELGYGSIDNMSLPQKLTFQLRYLERKLAMERPETEYLTDRSFIDIAAYWIEYNRISPDTDDEFISTCRQHVSMYDEHFYFPVGIVPLEADGFRSVDTGSRLRIDALIRALAEAWGIFCRPLDMADLAERTAVVLDSIGRDAP